MRVLACRLVAPGHLFCIPDPATDPEQELLEALSCIPSSPSTSSHQDGTSQPQDDGLQTGNCRSARMPDLLWFKITAVEPPDIGPLAVDPAATAVAMQVRMMVISRMYFKDKLRAPACMAACDSGGEDCGITQGFGLQQAPRSPFSDCGIPFEGSLSRGQLP